ncbi:hypothetical protein K2173_002199 [Erythroxylum novogranatense]|uniref:Uncharacterized protein n=1 Tax=Erythroxylum novogranatense TaxID=1862640 RepID=A0AAV8TQN5_9ROSI|nr:hypothetical protein K2173_002199 [Erythroxylum novogranatense]
MLKTNCLIFLIVAAVAPIHGLDTRKLDETAVPGSGEKCAPCNPSPPPPSSSPPPPPPPLCPPPPPPVLPPPPPKKLPPSGYCPPPPASFIYITGPPGELYPVDNDFSGAKRGCGLSPVLVVCGLLGFFVRMLY